MDELISVIQKNLSIEQSVAEEVAKVVGGKVTND